MKLILSYLLVIFFSFGLVDLFLDRNLEDKFLQDIKSSLINQANLIENQIPADSLQNPDTNYLNELIKNLSARIKSRITIVDRQGRVLADSEKSGQEVFRMGNHLNRPEIKSAFQGEIGIDTRYSSTLKINMLYTALPIKDKSGIVGALRLSIPLTNIQKALWTIRKTILLGLFFAIALAFLIGSILAGQTIYLINRMIDISRKFAKGDFSSRIFRSSRDEIGQLADTFNKMAQDIEDKIREIQKQNQQLAAVFDSMIEGVIAVDKTGHIISINPAIEKIFGVSQAIAKGKFFLEAIPNNDILEIINSVLKDGNPVSKDLNLTWPVQKIFQVNAVAIFENENVSGCFLVIHDITEIKRLETMRRDFVANVSHELKTPLTSIKGFVETLLEGALEDKENNRHFLMIIQQHVDRLNNLINDLLDLSRIESRRIELDISNFSLEGLVDNILPAFKSQFKKKNIEANNDLAAGLLVKADKDRIEQVLINLIDNAIKFNKEKGFIRIYAEDLDDIIKVIIEDSGIGIPAKDIPRIFERFYRVDKARSRELGGTGLGLSIVKHIVELHSGSVGVESTDGLGSKFWFSLPK
jgi:two-component system phosphate regulon sensor histidine kinase PhoR